MDSKKLVKCFSSHWPSQLPETHIGATNFTVITYLLRSFALKTLVIGTTFILALASFGSAAYGNGDGSNKEACQSIPLGQSTGGAYRERPEAMQRCKTEVRSRGPQTTNTSLIGQPNPPSSVPSLTRQNQDLRNWATQTPFHGGY